MKHKSTRFIMRDSVAGIENKSEKANNSIAYDDQYLLLKFVVVDC